MQQGGREIVRNPASLVWPDTDAAGGGREIVRNQASLVWPIIDAAGRV